MVYVWRHQRPAYRTIQHVTRSCLSADPTRRVSRPAIGMLGACRRWHLARLALARANRGVSLHHQPVRLALGLSLQCLLGGLRFGSGECGRRCTSLNYLRPLTGLSRNHCLEGGNRLFQLLTVRLLIPAECSSFISFGTSSAHIFMYAAGCVRRTRSIAFAPPCRKFRNKAEMNSPFNCWR